MEENHIGLGKGEKISIFWWNFNRNIEFLDGRRQDFFGGNTFRKLKKFLRKLRKMHYFSIFFKWFNKPYVNFMRVWTKNTSCWKIWENLSKNFLGQLRKCIILAYFSKKVNKSCVNFSRFGRKTKIIGKFWEDFEIFWWKFYWKIEFLFYF